MDAIKPYTTTLNAANACWMARLAREVYTRKSKKDPRPDETRMLARLKKEDRGFRSVHGFSQHTAQAALIEHRDYFCMSFRGTDQTLDWLDNVDAFPVQEIFGKFHRGFWKSTEDVWTGLFERYETLAKKKPRPLFLTGHSLGGAMATIAAAKLIHNDLPFISVYTFGQPRAIERQTSRLFNMECKQRFFRFQNNNDLVTRVPARLMGYSHVGTCIYITEEKSLHDDPGFWFRFLDSLDGAMEAFRETGIDMVEDHAMDNYLDAIDRWDARFPSPD